MKVRKKTRRKDSLVYTSTFETSFANQFVDSPPPRLFHYTNQESFAAIVNSESFWATDVRYLSDYEEYGYAVKKAKETIQSVSLATSIPGAKELGDKIYTALSKDIQKRYYVFSLSEDRDSLNQWRSYTRPGPGCALGFETTALQLLCKEKDFLLGKCIYSKKKAETVISDLVFSYIRDLIQYFPLFDKGDINEDLIVARSARFVDLFAKYAVFFKHPAFEEEKEWRIVASTTNAQVFKQAYRCGPHSMIPYVVLEWSGRPFLRALKEVVIKPMPHIKLAEQSVHEFIRHRHNESDLPPYCFDEFKTQKSAVPFREGS